MSAITLTKETKWTAQAYFDWSLPEDETRYEVINGKLIKMASPTLLHQKIAARLHAIILFFLDIADVGMVLMSPVDIVLGEQVFIPDVAFLRKEREHICGEKRVNGAPDMVVEVLSPSTKRRDLTDKMEIYAEHGVEEYWVIAPKAETVDLYVLDGEGYALVGTFGRTDTIQSQVITGFELPLAQLFR